MSGKNKRIINFIQVLILLVTFLIVAVPMPLTAADRGDSVKDKPLKKHLRTLEGKAFLDHPITGATVQIYDLSDSLLYSVESATGENGSFSITEQLPKSFWIEITDGYMDGEPFDHDVRRYIRLFKERDYYKVNAVTTLMAEYQARPRQPKLSHMQIKKAVANYLSIPDSTDLDEIIYSSEWFCYHFSHYLFMKEMEAGEGLSEFIGQLVDEIEAGETRSFYDTESVGSSLFQDAMAALLEGAMSEFGGEGAGWILGLLDHGGGDDDRFKDMQDDLGAILSDLKNIINALKGLADQLALDMNKVETYIAGINAQTAITLIKSHYGPEGELYHGDQNDLKWYSYFRAEDYDSTLKTKMDKFVDNVNGVWDIETQVLAIHDAIIPDIGGTEGLLDLWTKDFILQGHVSDDQLMNYYKTLESYFGVLLFYQFKGANMVVEALNYQSSSGETPALSYLTGTFQPQIKEQTDRFLKCVTKLIANNCGLYWESKFLPSTAQEIFARATFFVTQTLGEDHYGLRAGLFGTSNLVHDIDSVYALDVSSDGPSDGVTSGDHVEMVDIDVPDKPYDYWGTLVNPDLSTLKKGTLYSLAKCDFGAADSGTTHQVFYWNSVDSNWVYIGSVEVKTYTKNYIEDPDGKIAYGYLLGEFRRGGKEVIMDPSVFVRNYYKNDHSGDVNWWYKEELSDDNLYLYVQGKNKYTNSSSHIGMVVQWYHPFTFDGSESTQAYLNIAGHLFGSVYIHHENSWSNEARIGYNVGVYDNTNHKIISYIHETFKATVNDKRQDYIRDPSTQISFTLEPGVTYFVYGDIEGYGSNYSGDYEYALTIWLHHLSLTFVNSEF